MPSIGEKIKELRSAKKMTQEALAQNLNVTVSAVSQWESGKTMPDISMLVPLCHMFSVSADDLLGIRIGEQDAVLNETKSEVEKLVANGDYDAAFTELRKKIADFPDNVQFRVDYCLLIMKFCEEVKGREEEKEALCDELYDIMINKHHLDKYGKEDEAERKISIEIMIFVINHALFRRFNHQAKVLLQKVDDLIGAGKFEEVRQVVLKEAERRRRGRRTDVKAGQLHYRGKADGIELGALSKECRPCPLGRDRPLRKIRFGKQRRASFARKSIALLPQSGGKARR